MNNSLKATSYAIFFVSLFSIGHALAADKVVVVPLNVQSPATQWVLVSDAGIIVNQSGGIYVLVKNTGRYWLDFGNDLTGHAIIGTQQSLGDSVGGTVIVTICGGADAIGETHFCGLGQFESTSAVNVVTKRNDGVIADRPFYLVVLP